VNHKVTFDVAENGKDYGIVTIQKSDRNVRTLFYFFAKCKNSIAAAHSAENIEAMCQPTLKINNCTARN
jgi:hypothetical protein